MLEAYRLETVACVLLNHFILSLFNSGFRDYVV
jgi:hypothetical protein